MPTAIEDEANETPVQEKAKVTELFYDAPVVNDNLSTYEKQQAKMKATIKTLEEENIGEKKWTLKGEASSKIRPLNSLLEEDLEFEQTSKPIPVITEETTATLDDMIIQRIKDQAWDDVVKAAPIKNSVFDPNRRFELQDEKSSKTLGEIYEEDYMKKAKPGEYTTEKDAALEKQHTEIDLIFTNLCNSLDALSNFHYTPKAATMEVTVMPAPSVPAISMEDVTPANVSAAMIAAPNEVYSAKAGKSQAEMDRVDKKNARVKAKRNALKDRKARELAKAMAEKNTTTQAAMTQQGAIKKLMSQSNVTMIAANGKEKKSFGKGAARVIEKGGKLTKEKAVHMPEMLKL